MEIRTLEENDKTFFFFFFFLIESQYVLGLMLSCFLIFLDLDVVFLTI